MRYRDMTAEQKEEHKARVRKWKAEHHEEYKAYHRKSYAKHSEEVKAYRRKYRAEHKAYRKKWNAEDLNKNGIPKNNVRSASGRILVKVHRKIRGYEIHHCFGYEDPDKFIYIPKKLHDEIHSFLKRLGIPSDENHWNVIRDMVNSCEEYTYIRC